MSGVQDLIDTIDNHLADQMARQPSRPPSRGTMFVDYEDGEYIVSYRNQRQPEPIQEPYLGEMNWIDDGLEIRYQPEPLRSQSHKRPPAGSEVPRKDDKRGVGEMQQKPPTRAIVKGKDAKTGFAYDYDGNVFHVHKRRRDSAGSKYSEYYQLEANKYSPETGFRVVDNNSNTLSENRKRDKVVGFIGKVLKKLNSLGLMKRLKDDHRRKMARPHSEPQRSHAASDRSGSKHSRGTAEHSSSRRHRHTYPETNQTKPLPQMPPQSHSRRYNDSPSNIRRKAVPAAQPSPITRKAVPAAQSSTPHATSNKHRAIPPSPQPRVPNSWNPRGYSYNMPPTPTHMRVR